VWSCAGRIRRVLTTAATLTAVALVGCDGSAAPSHSAVRPTEPSPSPQWLSATPGEDVLVVPVGNGVPSRLDIVDWSGHDVGTIRNPGASGVPAKFSGTAPDGASFVSTEDGIRSLTGSTLGSVTGQWMWADDSAHLCELQSVAPASPVSAQMHYVTLGKSATTLGTVEAKANGTTIVPLLGSCSASHNLLSVIFDSLSWTTEVDEYSISPFRLVRSINLSNDQVLVSTVSEDGAYMVEEVGLSPAQAGPPTGIGVSSRVVRVSDMVAVASYSGQSAVMSANDETVLTQTLPASSSGRVEVWLLGGSSPVATFAGQFTSLARRPESGDVFLAVTTGSVGDNPFDGTRTLIVQADGTVVPVTLE